MPKTETIKKRNWTFVLYPESAPSDWKEQLRQSGLLCAVSPLHDRDTNPTGEPKKPHHHIILVYAGPTTYNAVAKFTSRLNSTIPQDLESVRGLYRYFTHKDNPEKAQYEERDILCLNGFNIGDLVELTKSEVNEIKFRILQIIRDADLNEYCDLINFLIDNGMLTECDVACNNTFFFNAYVASRRHSTSRVADRQAAIAAMKPTASALRTAEPPPKAEDPAKYEAPTSRPKETVIRVTAPLVRDPGESNAPRDNVAEFDNFGLSK